MEDCIECTRCGSWTLWNCEQLTEDAFQAHTSDPDSEYMCVLCQDALEALAVVGDGSPDSDFSSSDNLIIPTSDTPIRGCDSEALGSGSPGAVGHPIQKDDGVYADDLLLVSQDVVKDSLSPNSNDGMVLKRVDLEDSESSAARTVQDVNRHATQAWGQTCKVLGTQPRLMMARVCCWRVLPRHQA